MAALMVIAERLDGDYSCDAQRTILRFPYTDCESQYCAHPYQKILRRHGFSLSMSGKGDCYDNSAPCRQNCCANRLPGNG